MVIETYRFGEVEIDEAKILTFEKGIPGFEKLHRFAIVSLPDVVPFFWLQSLDDTDIALAVVNPFDIAPDYAPKVDDEVFDELRAESEEDMICVAVTVIPEAIEKATMNLAAPILINARLNLGKQVVLEGNYDLRYPIFKSTPAGSETKGGGADAGTDAQDRAVSHSG
ncbi:flagellar assembly protein FliW [Oscillospiraceae bacterium OttesenSCG-928-F05]|nr:flagellar assembly protein FliW [Oscillospiraceae bacterium OttesenSCG-928-F05]